MFASHRPRVFRSRLGCCICGAKSSSSRFTSSSKYELLFSGCFQLNEKRQGEICNACVLLVKRWKKLPPGSSKNWKHVRKEMSIDVLFYVLRNCCRFNGCNLNFGSIYFPRCRLLIVKQLWKELPSQGEVLELWTVKTKMNWLLSWTEEQQVVVTAVAANKKLEVCFVALLF